MTESEMIEWGRKFGEKLAPRPFVVALRGDLGTGKTTLAQALCAGYGVTEDVTSPTYAIVHKYASAKAPVFHLDLYRLDGPRDLQNIGFDEIIAGDSMVIVEWPERAEGRMPGEKFDIHLSMVDGDPSRRRVALGASYIKSRWYR